MEQNTNAVPLLMDALKKEDVAFLPQEALKNHTSFRIGGPAAVYCMPESAVELACVRRLCRELGVRTYLLGNGSNTLFSDAGFPGAVIEVGRPMGRITVQGNRLFVGAGASLMAVCRKALEESLTGMEFAYGIPGYVGGAVYMNAGAYGGEMKDVLRNVTFLDESLCVRTLSAEELALGYRTSVFEQHPDWSILEAELELQPGNAEEIRAKMDDLMFRRKDKQPLEWPSAGSTFKRPQGAFAGKLIEDCGLKGYRVGGAAVSTKHCGFVVNVGEATCADVVQLTEDVKRIVQEQTGYVLEREIRVVE